ncbi:MAG: ATP-binding cassette domain-containing protein [Lachnospiraceae bacterium]|nr:ATP-binding cassette domain-containing protein [Lachnospiraceae bacterium]
MNKEVFPNRQLNISDILKFRLRYVRPWEVAVIILVAAASAAISMLMPGFTKLLTGDVVEYKSMELLLAVAVFIVGAEFISQLIKAVRTIVSGTMYLRLRKLTEGAVMERMLSLPISFYRRFQAGQLYSMMTAVGDLGDIFSDGLIAGLISALTSLVFVTRIVHFAPMLILPALIIIIATTVLSIITVLIKKRVETGRRPLEAVENGVSLEMIRNAEKIKQTGSEEAAYKKWERSYLASIEKKYDLPLLLKISPAMIKAINLFGALVIYYLAAKSGVEVSDYLAFNIAYGGLLSGIGTLSDTGLTFASIPPIYEMARPILEAVPEDESDKLPIENLQGDIELKNVTFGYEKDRPVLKDISLHIRAGEYVAIVGETGCGKTTLIRLLLGLEKPDSGNIFYDGKDMETLSKKSLRKNMGAVIQDGKLFRDDILNNIVIGHNELTEADAWEAAQIAGIADEIRDLPLGMNTPIAENCSDVSGGQKQRILIARAVAHKPEVLILDEATSALNDEMQDQIMSELEKLSVTRIVVAHRMSAVKNAGRVITISDGSIC